MCFWLQTESTDTSACPLAEPTEGSFPPGAVLDSCPCHGLTSQQFCNRKNQEAAACSRWQDSLLRQEDWRWLYLMHGYITLSPSKMSSARNGCSSPNKYLKLSLRLQASLGFALEPSQRSWQWERARDWRPLRMELMASPEIIRKLQLSHVLFTQGLLFRWVALKRLFRANCWRSKVSAERKSKLVGTLVSAWQSHPCGEGRKTPGPFLPHRAQALRILSDAGRKVLLIHMLKWRS